MLQRLLSKLTISLYCKQRMHLNYEKLLVMIQNEFITLFFQLLCIVQAGFISSLNKVVNYSDFCKEEKKTTLSQKK